MKFLLKLIFLICFLEQSHSTDQLKALLKGLEEKNSDKDEILLFTGTPNHSPENCLFIYSPKQFEKEFSGIVCYELKVFYQKIETSANKKLVLWVKSISTAYVTKDRKIAKPTIEVEENGKLISYQTGLGSNLLSKQGYKFLFLENKTYSEEKTFEIDFNKPNPTELSIYPICDPISVHKDTEYTDCNSSKNIRVPFGLGNLHFNFTICQESKWRRSILAYDIEIYGNFRDGIKKFDDERFGNSNFSNSIFYILYYFSNNENMESNYEYDLIRILMKSEEKILEEKIGSLFNLEDRYFKQNGYFESSLYEWNDLKIFSDEDYEKYKEKEEKSDYIKRNDFEHGDDKKKDGDKDDEKRDENKTSAVGMILASIFLFAFLGLIGYCIYYYLYFKKNPKL